MQKIYSLEIGSRDKEQGRLLFRSLDGGCGRPIWSHPPLLFFSLYGYRNRPAINRKCTAWAVLVGTGAGKSILISGQSVCSMLHFIVHNI